MNKTRILLLAVFSSSIIILGTTLGIYYGIFYNKQQIAPHPNGNWSIMVNGNLEFGSFNITVYELLAMTSYSEDYIIKGSTTFTANYKGVQINYLLNNIIDYNSSATIIKFIAFDSYFISFLISEILENDRIIIAYQKDNVYLTGPEESGEGYLRLIVPQINSEDYNGPKCLKNCIQIQII